VGERRDLKQVDRIRSQPTYRQQTIPERGMVTWLLNF